MVVKFPHVTVRLSGENGNAFAILARVREAMRKGGVSMADRDAYMKAAMAGDYDHLLQITMQTVNVE